MIDKPVQVTHCDVVVCGGGLAGLSLARQLMREQPERSVVVLERQRGPLPDSAHKVGESTIESGAYYFGQILGLEGYLEESQLEKLGLRYFFGGGHLPLAERPEFGVADFLPAKSYQLDRGTLENHLRDSLRDGSRTTLVEGADVREIDLSPDEHRVTYRLDGEVREVHARWAVDAMGRRRYLQRKLGLGRDCKLNCNSVWFRVRGRMSVDDWVPAENAPWHARVNEDRWYSTVHLMGEGYWVWLIPLATGNTSIGIVALDTMHCFSEYDTFEKARAWLVGHEPELAQRLDDFPLMDFKKLKGYSYTSSRVFSDARWACVGEAGSFADPYYSVGSNMIAFANGLTAQMIAREFAGALEPDFVDHANRLFLSLNDNLTENIRRGYPFYHRSHIMALKTIWDYYVGWTTTDPQLYHEIYLDPELTKAMSNLITRVIAAQARMLHLFESWAAMTEENPSSFGFIDYIEDLPTLRDLFVTNLPPKTDRFRVILKNLREAVNRIEELACVIFFMAVEELMPSQTARLPDWINITAISLDPDRWEADGLFQPKTKPRDLTPLRTELERLFDREEAATPPV